MINFIICDDDKQYRKIVENVVIESITAGSPAEGRLQVGDQLKTITIN